MGILNRLFGSSKKTEITSPFDAKPELQTERGVRKYLSKLTKLDRSGLCIEFANVRAAKHNVMTFGSDVVVKALVTDLTDKSTLICIVAFGRDAVLGYNGGDLASFNELVNDLDDEISTFDFEPEQYGERLLFSVGSHLQ